MKANRLARDGFATLLVAWSLLADSSGVLARDAISLPSLRAVPGARICVAVRGNLEDPIEGYSLAIEYDAKVLSLREDDVTFEDAAGGTPLDFTGVHVYAAGRPGELETAVIGVVVQTKERPGAFRTVPGGDGILLCTLRFEVSPDAPLGSTPVRFVDAHETAPMRANVIVRGGGTPIWRDDGLRLTDGGIQVSCFGDGNGDGRVDFGDLIGLSNCWSRTGCDGPVSGIDGASIDCWMYESGPRETLECDAGRVDFCDLLAFSDAWHTECPVPGRLTGARKGRKEAGGASVRLSTAGINETPAGKRVTVEVEFLGVGALHAWDLQLSWDRLAGVSIANPAKDVEYGEILACEGEADPFRPSVTVDGGTGAFEAAEVLLGSGVVCSKDGTALRATFQVAGDCVLPVIFKVSRLYLVDGKGEDLSLSLDAVEPLEVDVPRPIPDASPETVAFPETCAGAKSIAAFEVANEGSAEFAVTSISCDAPFAVLAPEVPFMLEPGATREVSVEFAPPAAGETSGDCIVETDTPCGVGPLLVRLEGTAIDTRIVELPGGGAPVALGKICLEKETERALPVGNAGCHRLRIEAIELTAVEGPAGAFQISGLPVEIEPGGSADLTVRFTPPAAGSYRATGTVRGDATGGDLELVLQGTCLDELTADCQCPLDVPPAVDFGPECVGEESERSLTLALASCPDEVRVTDLATSAPFAIGPISLPFSIAPGAGVEIPLLYRPELAGAHEGELVITSDATNSDPEGRIIVPLHGSGVTAGVSVERESEPKEFKTAAGSASTWQKVATLDVPASCEAHPVEWSLSGPAADRFETKEEGDAVWCRYTPSAQDEEPAEAVLELTSGGGALATLTLRGIPTREVRLWLDATPAKVTEPDQTIEVAVMARAWRLHAYELGLRWSPAAALQVPDCEAGVIAGDLLSQAGVGAFFGPPECPPATDGDLSGVSGALLGAGTAVSGEGWLFTIRFRVVDLPLEPIVIDLVDPSFLDAENEPLIAPLPGPLEIPPLECDPLGARGEGVIVLDLEESRPATGYGSTEVVLTGGTSPFGDLPAVETPGGLELHVGWKDGDPGSGTLSVRSRVDFGFVREQDGGARREEIEIEVCDSCPRGPRCITLPLSIRAKLGEQGALEARRTALADPEALGSIPGREALSFALSAPPAGDDLVVEGLTFRNIGSAGAARKIQRFALYRFEGATMGPRPAGEPAAFQAGGKVLRFPGIAETIEAGASTLFVLMVEPRSLTAPAFSWPGGPASGAVLLALLAGLGLALRSWRLGRSGNPLPRRVPSARWLGWAVVSLLAIQLSSCDGGGSSNGLQMRLTGASVRQAHSGRTVDTSDLKSVQGEKLRL